MNIRNATGSLERLPPWWAPLGIFVVVIVLQALLFVTMTEVMLPDANGTRLADVRVVLVRSMVRRATWP